VPGAEPHVFEAIRAGGPQSRETTGATVDSIRLVELSRLLRQPGAVIMVGERLAGIPGALSAVARLADDTGAALAWVPRRAGERGAIEAGALPGLLPGGRPLCDPEARRQVHQVWGGEVPAATGRDTAGILAAATE